MNGSPASVFLSVALHPFDGANQADGERQDKDLVERFQENLEEHKLGDFCPADEASEGNGEEDEGVGRFAHYGGDDGAQGEVAAAAGQLHATHHVGVQDGTYQEGGQTGGHDARCHAKDEVEVGTVLPVGGSGQLYGQETEADDEEVHEEARPDNEAGLVVAPDFCDAVVDDVRDGEHEQSAGYGELAHGNELCFQKVGGDEANVEENAHQHEGEGYFLIHSFLLMCSPFARTNSSSSFLLMLSRSALS